MVELTPEAVGGVELGIMNPAPDSPIYSMYVEQPCCSGQCSMCECESNNEEIK